MSRVSRRLRRSRRRTEPQPPADASRLFDAMTPRATSLGVDLKLERQGDSWSVSGDKGGEPACPICGELLGPVHNAAPVGRPVRLADPAPITFRVCQPCRDLIAQETCSKGQRPAG